MLRSLENLLGYQIAATDGLMGTVADFLFLDDTWKIRYLGVDAGSWLHLRHVLLSTSVVREVVDSSRQVRVNLTKEAVYTSPDIESDKPVTRQKETLLASHYGWKPYWTPDPFLGVDLPTERLDIAEELPGSNPHLRSFREVTNYTMEGAEPFGFITDAIVQEEPDWQVVGLVASPTRGRKKDSVLAAPQRVHEIDWTHRIMRITDDPPPLAFDPKAPVNARRIVRYYDYLGRLHHSTPLPESEERK